MCQCKTCECAVCSRWARTCICAWRCNVHPQAQRCVGHRHSSSPISLSFSTQVLLRYKTHASDCNPCLVHVFRGGIWVLFFLFSLGVNLLSIWSVNTKLSSDISSPAGSTHTLQGSSSGHAGQWLSWGWGRGRRPISLRPPANMHTPPGSCF